MGLAEEIRKSEKPPVESGGVNSEVSPAFQDNKIDSNIEPAESSLENNKQPEEEIATAEQYLEQATEQPVTPEERFAEKVADKLVNDDLLLVINRKKEFLKAVDKFVIENFYHKQKDKKLDQIALGKFLFKKLYKPFLDKANRYYFEQEAFVYAGNLLRFFKEKNL